MALPLSLPHGSTTPSSTASAPRTFADSTAATPISSKIHIPGPQLTCAASHPGNLRSTRLLSSYAHSGAPT
ncbi:hypothetical protein N7530_008131 [Penicillium desertorum]|uniref:Uncharacterized protein n=1 Tax=Penicillium desertorum TaxID=1303715 RepID=A0A9W9WNI1_9EURO|nr:hypothetical protein N7530_008131 [Penicillium desertorum]